MINAGVIGDDTKEPRLGTEAFEILFDGMARSLNLEAARSLNGSIEWNFTDADPWHLVVTNGHAEAKPGVAGKPALRFTTNSADWAKFTVGRIDPRRALLQRKLKVKGSLSARARLPKLFN